MTNEAVRGPRALPPADREALLRATRSQQVTYGVGVRARAVLDCAEVGATEAARRAGVSVTTVNRWWRVYRENGVGAVLAVTPPPGRPTVTGPALRSVLTRTLTPPPDGAGRWTTRAIAEASGVSQATVSRIRRHHFPAAADPDPGDEALVLTYVDVGPAGCALGFARTAGDPARPAPSPGVTDTVETVLCAALLRAPGADPAPDGDTAELLRRAERRVDLTSPITLSGRVTGVEMVNGSVILNVGGVKLNLTDVEAVREIATTEA